MTFLTPSSHRLILWHTRLAFTRSTVRFASLPNLLLDAPVLPEALFDACSPERVAEMLRYRPCLGSLCVHRSARGHASDETMRHIGRIVACCSASRSKLH